MLDLGIVTKLHDLLIVDSVLLVTVCTMTTTFPMYLSSNKYLATYVISSYKRYNLGTLSPMSHNKTCLSPI